VRDMLRQVFPEVAWTENDVRALIQRSRETLAEQALADGTFVAEEGDTSFSLSEAPGEPRSLEGAATREEVESRLMQGMTQQERAELFTDAEWAQIVDATMAETAQPAEAPQISELQQQLQDEHPGLELFTTQRGDVATIQRIELPAAQREQGTGTQIMEQITGWADENGITLALTPTADFGGAVGRLRDFYQRHGFADNTGRARDHAISETMVRRPAGGEDVLFSLGDQADRPTATQVRDSLQGIEGLGRPEVLDTANQLDLDTGLRLTLRGLDPQTVVAFHDDAGRLRVIAGNAESPQAAVQAAVLERVKRNGLGAVLGDRLNTIGKNAYAELPGNTAAREALRTVRAEYDYLNPSLPGDR
ncbi:GNAT family N-acetyltransferase, partial [uncultured Halomonas sp.]|uniref:GNAT family N-acetyltransferase n=1 Tax=uncultured Halomonas sp. TaxID=173971 RepID=UPI002630AB82